MRTSRKFSSTLHATPAQQGIHGDALLAAALQDAAGGLHHGEQADGHGAHLQQLARDGQVLGGVAARVNRNRMGLARMLMPTAQGKPITAAMRRPVMLSRDT